MAQQGRRRTRCALAAGLVLLGSGALQAVVTSPAGAAGSDTRQLVSRGTSTPTGGTSVTRHGGLFTGASVVGDAAGAGGGTNRSQSIRGGRQGAGSTGLQVTGSTVNSFQGLGITDNAKTAGFVLEPPDQGLCVGNGKVLELVNVVGQVYSTGGSKQGKAFYLNDFFNEDPNLANASDPSCYYDQATNRFYADMLFYDSDSSGNFTGTSRIDIAVSDTGDAAGRYHVYSFDVTKDGSAAYNLGDYPQIGADAQGVYITTNSYPFFTKGFGGAQLYALSKMGLATGSDTSVTRIPLSSSAGATPFGLRPTTTPGRTYAKDTEYLLSSSAAQEAGNASGFSTSIGLWALTGTDSLAPGAGPRNLTIAQTSVPVDAYGVPPLSDQKAGPYPLGECLSITSCKTTVFGTTSAGTAHVEGQLDSSDSRMNQTVYSNGQLFGTLDTVVNVGGQDRAGLAYYVLKPSTTPALTASVVSQGQIGVAGNNLIYGAFGVDTAGKAVLATNLVGQGYYPSAGYVTFDADYRPSPVVHVSGTGAGPTDGFTEYTDFTGSLRPRYGDYAATAFDPTTGSIWTANEYVAQTCTVATYQADPTCRGTRSKYGNWSTRFTQVQP